MKTVILAGGYGTRISEESHLRPKPMIEIGGMPLLWHIMKLYSYYGFYDFVICAGYKQHVIKEWFADYDLYNSDITFDFARNGVREVHSSQSEPWRVTVVNTGLNTMTGGRIKRIKGYVGDGPFFLTYGDGLSNVDIRKSYEFHRSHGKLATLTAIMPEGRFGVMDLRDSMVRSFREKSREDSGWINGGFMILEPEVFQYIEGDFTTFEHVPLERLADEGNLCCFKHYGFWQCMDTLRDKEKLEKLWSSGSADWKVW